MKGRALATRELEFRARVAELCIELAELTDDARFRAAAGVLRAQHIGRPEMDDDAALDLARSLLDAGLVRSREAALRRAAAMFASREGFDAAVRRLRTKFRKQYLSS